MADLLVVDAIEKVYGEGSAATRALSGVSFTVAEGEFASIVGQSGSGKSTLLNLIGLLDTPTSGRVTLTGENTTALGRAGRARLRNEALGFVFQFHYLLPEFSVWENLTMPVQIARRTVSGEERDRALETLALLGLEGLERKNANQLSGGQKQRVAIGRALMNRPKLILADEPTGNLDTANTEAVYELFRTINAELGTTFLIVTHDRVVAQQTDRILEVRDGELVQDVRNDYAG
ncbi:MAG: ABC transporter ATP-binding protein [Coriobacteriia bacterium]|nr:ABC transporter ATP-binding protein [Coriobacteriia bacterium]